MKGSKASSSGSKGESHRIYWQQWPSSASSGGPPSLTSRRDLITSSAAIRISPDGARAQDVTNLLCETLNLKSPNNSDKNNSQTSALPPQESWDKVQDAWEQDSLVLVGTLYSLPFSYVSFEHERRILDAQQQQQQQLQQSQQHPSSSSSTVGDNTPMKETSSHSSSSGGKAQLNRSDPPFHVIKTLSASDNPIQIRDDMIQHLERLLEQATKAAAASSLDNASKKVTHSSIAPKLQWYFVPGIHHPSSPIPSYVDLDGYSTSLEGEGEGEAENDADEDDNSVEDHLDAKDLGNTDAENDFDPDNIENVALSLLEKNKVEEVRQETDQEASKTSLQYPEELIFQKERQRFFELSMCQSTLQHDCVSGYLLKQSMVDPHVWKRVYCVLTDDHLWYISRVYTKSKSTKSKDDDNPDDKDNETSEPNHNGFFSFAKHRRLGLTRALLIKPSADRPMAPLFRTPFAFEFIASDGIPHRFRAPTPALYKKWTEALSSRIVQSYENSLFEHADLIVRDETEARNKRFMAQVVEPLWENQKNNIANNINNNNNNNHHRYIAMDSPTMNILRFGIEVSEFRERCRHIQAILPPKHPVLAMTDSSSAEPAESHSSGHGGSNGEGAMPSARMDHAIRLDLPTQAMIKSAWDEAIRLGSAATKLAMGLQEDKGDKATMPRSLETICQHLEYVITGNFRRPSSGSTEAPKSRQQQLLAARNHDKTRQFPPPMDLFDVLLAELQKVAATVTKQKEASEHSSTAYTSSRGRGSGAPSMNGGQH